MRVEGEVTATSGGGRDRRGQAATEEEDGHGGRVRIFMGAARLALPVTEERSNYERIDRKRQTIPGAFGKRR